MITLDEFLNDLEFSYQINKESKTISLIDELGANLGNIETEEFEIWENLPIALVDRLDTYIYDYHISGIEDTLYHECQYKDDIYPYDENTSSWIQYCNLWRLWTSIHTKTIKEIIMLNQLKNMKSITVDVKNLLTAVTAIKKKQNRITLNIDYNSMTVYISDKDMLYTIKGF